MSWPHQPSFWPLEPHSFRNVGSRSFPASAPTTRIFPYTIRRIPHPIIRSHWHLIDIQHTCTSTFQAVQASKNHRSRQSPDHDAKPQSHTAADKANETSRDPKIGSISPSKWQQIPAITQSRHKHNIPRIIDPTKLVTIECSRSRSMLVCAHAQSLNIKAVCFFEL